MWTGAFREGCWRRWCLLGSLERQAGVVASRGAAVPPNLQNLHGQDCHKPAVFPEHRWGRLLYASPQSLCSCCEPIPPRLMLGRNGEEQLSL